MHITIDNASQFRDQFYAMNRQDQFSYEALGLLYDYIEEADSDAELDVIALCCEYSEDTEAAIMQAYGLHEDEDVTSYLSEHTSVVGVTSTGSIVYANF